MVDLSGWPLWGIWTTFAAAALIIGVFGSRLAGVAETLAQATRLGQAVFGAVFLGGITSLPGITTSVAAALDGHAALAVSNAMGGIAAQTVFLAVADVAHRKANLEHAAANVANLMQGALLVTLVVLPILATTMPDYSVASVHPISLAIVVGYLFGMRLVSGARTAPMWAPKKTPETAPPEKDAPKLTGAKLLRTWLAFASLAAIVAVAGYAVAATGVQIATRTGLSESVVGAFFTAVSTSLPELVTSVAAVRRGALTLAVGDILGGNCFDVLFVAASDVAYREGSIYVAIGTHELFVASLTVLLTGILLLGLLRREKHGIANIGFESMLVILLYFTAFALLLFNAS